MRIFAARKIFKIIQKLNELGQRRSAQLVAMALFGGHALKLLRIPEDAILLVPEDQSFGDDEFIESLMAADRGRQLVDALMNHVVASAAALGMRRNIRIVSGPHTVDEFSIYVVENLAFATAPGTQRNSCGAATIPVSPRSPTMIVRRSANNIEHFARRGLNRWRGPIRRIQLFVEPLPFIGPVAVKSMTVLRIFRTEGFIGIRRRLDLHPRYSIRRIRNVLAMRGSLKASGDDAQTSEAMGAAPSPKFPSTADQNALGEVRLLKSLLGMQSVLPEYESSCLPETIKSAPGEFVGSRLAAFAAGGGPKATMARVLNRLVIKYPDWCEAWLELGYVNVELGKATEAEAAFLKASQARQSTDPGNQFQNPRSVACLEWAGLLAARGDVRAACEAYRQGFEIDPRPFGVARAEFARLLQRAGHPWDAAEQFYQAAYCDLKFRPAPKAGRDAATITFSVLTATDREVTVSSAIA